MLRERRERMTKPLDWGTAESLAFASLLEEHSELMEDVPDEVKSMLPV